MSIVRSGASIIAVSAACATASAQVENVAAKSIDIEAMPMEAALNELAQQIDKQIVIYSADAAGLTAPELDGAFTEIAALETILEGTDLNFTYLNDRTIAVAPQSRLDAAINELDQPIQLAQLTEEDTPPVTDDDGERVLDTITVPGFRSSLASSLARKRNADQVLDAITAEDIGQFPDQNLTESIQRIAGVQITRNNGEGEQVNIRGLSAQFTRVELDGRSTNVTIDSSDPERGSVLSVFASDLYNSIEVIKSPTAADVEGGVGGIVRLKTPDPLDIGELTWGVEGGLLRSDVRDEDEPAITGFYANTFADDRFGILLAGTFEGRDRSIDKIQSNQNWREIGTGDLADDTDPTQLALVGGFYPGRIRLEQREEEADKINLNAKFQYAATDNLVLSLDGLYTIEERERELSRLQAQFSRTNRINSGTLDASTNTLIEGNFNRVRVEPIQQYRETDVETFGLTGGFDWNNDDWTVKGEVYFSSAEEDYIEYTAGGRENRTVGYSIENDPEYPELIFEPGDLDLAGFETLRSLAEEGRVISIEEQGFSLDAERFVDLGVFKSFEFGTRYASTEFDRKQGQVDAVGDFVFSDGVDGFVVDGTFAEGFGGAGLLRAWPSVDPQEFYNRFPGEGSFFEGDNADENVYDLTENTLAGYVVGNFEQESLFGLFARGNVGVRVVQTDYEGEGAVDLAGDGIDNFNNIGTQTLERDYTDVLPSFNIVLSQDADSNFLVRGAISRALSRPEVQAINPGLVIRIDEAESLGDPDTPDGTFEEGNPELDPFRAWQYDLGFEWYFGENSESAITAAIFVKDVENFVFFEDQARTFQDVGRGIGVNGPLNILSESFPVNGGEASIQGVELGLQTPFYFLPGLWSNFGMAANYTYTDSEFTTEDGVTFPFPGSSENAFNLVGYYEQGGFSGRLAYTYRDEFLITQNSADGTNTEFNDEDGRLDLGLRYRFDSGVRVSFDALNLTEQQNFKYYDIPQRLEDLEVEGRVYQVSVGYKF